MHVALPISTFWNQLAINFLWSSLQMVTGPLGMFSITSGQLPSREAMLHPLPGVFSETVDRVAHFLLRRQINLVANYFFSSAGASRTNISFCKLPGNFILACSKAPKLHSFHAEKHSKEPLLHRSSREAILGVFHKLSGVGGGKHTCLMSVAWCTHTLKVPTISEDSNRSVIYT